MQYCQGWILKSLKVALPSIHLTMSVTSQPDHSTSHGTQTAERHRGWWLGLTHLLIIILTPDVTLLTTPPILGAFCELHSEIRLSGSQP